MQFEPAFIEKLNKLVTVAGGKWIGLQESFVDGIATIMFEDPRTKTAKGVDFDADLNDFDPVKLFEKIRSKLVTEGAAKMTLKEKLYQLYITIDAIEKTGASATLKYRYVEATEVNRAVRRQLITLKVYAVINYDFYGAPYTIARAKEPGAPFSAILVKCFVDWHDLESGEIIKSSALGQGADTGDKAVYKAQTGALKYAIKNAALAPDKADPEADPTLDEGSDPSLPVDDMPDFQEAQHTAPRANTPKEKPAPVPAPVKAAEPKKEAAKPAPAPAQPAAAPVQQKLEAPREPGDEPTADGAMPTEDQMTGYRQAFKRLGDDLSTEGKLKSSAKLPVERKLLVFLLSITGAAEAKVITKAQWDNFFARVEAAKSNPEVSFIGLAKLVNKANGIEDKK